MGIRIYTHKDQVEIERDTPDGLIDHIYFSGKEYNELVEEIKKSENLKTGVNCPSCDGAGSFKDPILGKLNCDYCKGKGKFWV